MLWCQLTEDAAFAQRAGVLQEQPGVDTVSVVLMETRQDPQTLTPHRHTQQVHIICFCLFEAKLLWNYVFSFVIQINTDTSHPFRVEADLVVVEWLQTDGTVVCLHRLRRVAPRFGLAICFGL